MRRFRSRRVGRWPSHGIAAAHPLISRPKRVRRRRSPSVAGTGFRWRPLVPWVLGFFVLLVAPALALAQTPGTVLVGGAQPGNGAAMGTATTCDPRVSYRAPSSSTPAAEAKRSKR